MIPSYLYTLISLRTTILALLDDINKKIEALQNYEDKFVKIKYDFSIDSSMETDYELRLVYTPIETTMETD